MAKTVVVFDFDKTIIDCDSDNWVVDDLGATQRFDELLQLMPWNSAIDRMMSELHSQGRTVEMIADSLRRAPLPANAIAAIKSAYALGSELRIVSDANVFFIETILKHHGLLGYFSEINSNPGYVDEQGRLRILPYHDFKTSSHGCSLCPPNMCKSVIMKRIQDEAAAEGKTRVIYLGDGKGDYCPALRLSKEDLVMPRKSFPLWDLILSSPESMAAGVRGWSDAQELESILLQLIKDSVSADSCKTVAAQFANSADCRKLQMMKDPILADGKMHIPQLSATEALPKPVSAPN